MTGNPSVSLRQAGDLLCPTRHDNSTAPSLHRHYPASSLLWAAPTPAVQVDAVIDSRTTIGLQTPARRVSRVPRPVFRYAPSALTPTGRYGACADDFPHRAGFSFSGSLATCNLCFEADPGSTFDGLRLTASLSTAFDRFARLLPRTDLAPRASLPPRDRPQLHASSAFTWQPPFRLLDWPGFARRTEEHGEWNSKNCRIGSLGAR